MFRLRVTREYPGNWNSLRKEVYKRDDHICQNCGKKGGEKGSAELNAHHIVPKKKGGSDKKGNLKTLCVDCHNAIHHNEKMAPTSKSHSVRDENNDEDESRSRGLLWWLIIGPIQISIWLTIVSIKLSLAMVVLPLRFLIRLFNN